jgi:hypothetical protein
VDPGGEWSVQLTSSQPAAPRRGQRLIVGAAGGVLRSELNCGSTTVWSGDWPVQLRVGTRLLEPKSWQEICRHSDDDVDYVELETEWTGGWRLQRQILLAREDHFLWTADAVTGPDAQPLEYRSGLPLAAGVRFIPERETRDGLLAGRQRIGRVFPVALPEWRAAAAAGSLECVRGRLQVRQQVQSQGLYAPLFFDLAAHRRSWPATWRQLTVAEQLQIQKPDVAVGYRVQVGIDQWLFYRSLAAPAARTLLGQHTAHEFLAARFDEEGEADQLLAIDATG